MSITDFFFFVFSLSHTSEFVMANSTVCMCACLRLSFPISNLLSLFSASLSNENHRDKQTYWSVLTMLITLGEIKSFCVSLTYTHTLYLDSQFNQIILNMA